MPRKKKASPKKRTTKQATPKQKPRAKAKPKPKVAKKAPRKQSKKEEKRGRAKSNPAFAKKIGANVKKARESAGMTQAVLSKRLGVAPPRVAAIEKGSGGEPKLSTLLKISKVLKVSLDNLATKVAETSKKPDSGSEEE